MQDLFDEIGEKYMHFQAAAWCQIEFKDRPKKADEMGAEARRASMELGRLLEEWRALSVLAGE
jgi:hypothetical protein